MEGEPKKNVTHGGAAMRHSPQLVSPFKEGGATEEGPICRGGGVYLLFFDHLLVNLFGAAAPRSENSLLKLCIRLIGR